MTENGITRNRNYWIKKLNLERHTEGGYYSEIYKSDLIITSDLPEGFSGRRTLMTSIYYLLAGNDISCFHRLKSDELWHFYDGSPLLLHVIDNRGNLETHKLCNNPDKGEFPVIIIPKNNWFAAEVLHKDSFTLSGCTVAPGFDYDDLEFGDRKTLISQFPQHEDLIKRFTQ